MANVQFLSPNQRPGNIEAGLQSTTDIYSHVEDAYAKHLRMKSVKSGSLERTVLARSRDAGCRWRPLLFVVQRGLPFASVHTSPDRICISSCIYEYSNDTLMMMMSGFVQRVVSSPQTRYRSAKHLNRPLSSNFINIFSSFLTRS